MIGVRRPGSIWLVVAALAPFTPGCEDPTFEPGLPPPPDVLHHSIHAAEDVFPRPGHAGQVSLLYDETYRRLERPDGDVYPSRWYRSPGMIVVHTEADRVAAFVAPDSLHRSPRNVGLFVSTLEGRELFTLPGDEVSLDVTILDDGSVVFATYSYASSATWVRSYESDGRLREESELPPSLVTLSRDGTRAISTTPYYWVEILPAPGDTMFAEPGREIQALTYSPDGSSVAWLDETSLWISGPTGRELVGNYVNGSLLVWADDRLVIWFEYPTARWIELRQEGSAWVPGEETEGSLPVEDVAGATPFHLSTTRGVTIETVEVGSTSLRHVRLDVFAFLHGGQPHAAWDATGTRLAVASDSVRVEEDGGRTVLPNPYDGALVSWIDETLVVADRGRCPWELYTWGSAEAGLRRWDLEWSLCGGLYAPVLPGRHGSEFWLRLDLEQGPSPYRLVAVDPVTGDTEVLERSTIATREFSTSSSLLGATLVESPDGNLWVTWPGSDVRTPALGPGEAATFVPGLAAVAVLGYGQLMVTPIVTGDRRVR